MITSGLLKLGIRVILWLLYLTQFLTFKIFSFAAFGYFYNRKFLSNREFFILLYTFRFLLMAYTKEETDIESPHPHSNRNDKNPRMNIIVEKLSYAPEYLFAPHNA